MILEGFRKCLANPRACGLQVFLSVFCHTLFRVAVFGKWSIHFTTPRDVPNAPAPTCFFHAGRIHFAFDQLKGQQQTVARKTPCATDLAKGKDATPRGRGGVKKKNLATDRFLAEKIFGFFFGRRLLRVLQGFSRQQFLDLFNMASKE